MNPHPISVIHEYLLDGNNNNDAYLSINSRISIDTIDNNFITSKQTM
ncbi:MAG: hypothetical protein AB7I49_08620 [Candidatus Nitrosocosmicus sp.]